VKSKLKFILPVLVVLAVAGGGAYKFVLAKPAKAAAVKPKVDGSLFDLSPEFVVNLTDNHYGKVTVALLLKEAPTAAQIDATGDAPRLVQDPVIRSIVTDDLTGIPSSQLINRGQRDKLRAQILKDLQKSTDVDVTGVLFTDVVVQ
jgi:flagellar basal body-associated protein FliL